MFQIAGFYFKPYSILYIYSEFIFICNILEILTAGTVVLNIFFVSGFHYYMLVYILASIYKLQPLARLS